jgi:hypothetical protein
MRFSMFAVSSFCMALGVGVVAGCEDDDDEIDEGVSTGGVGGSTAAGGAGGTYGTGGSGAAGGTGGTAGTNGAGGGAGGSAAGAGGTTAGAGGTTAGTAGNGGTTVTYAQVQPLFMAKCTPCHSAGGLGAGAHTLADSNADAPKPGAHPACMGTTKGECSLIRVKDGSMPLGKGCTGDPARDAANPACLTQQEQDLLAAWIDGGLM